MNFLAPWFLAAAALIAGPIIAHLIRRVTRQRVTFSATRFLEASPPQLQRRSRLQHPWLLLLRCLIVAMLALAFARPFFRGQSPTPGAIEATQDVVILLDESASMRRAGIWNEARDRVVRAAEALRPSDRCTVLLGGAGATPLLTAEQWAQLPSAERGPQLRSLLSTREPGWSPFYLDTAVDAALEVFSDSAKEATRQRLIVVSDFASGTRVAGLAGRDWPPGCEVVLERTFPPIANNAGLQFLGWNESPGVPSQARIRLTRDQGAPPLRLSLQWKDGLNRREIGAAQTVDLGAGESRLVLLPLPPDASGPLEVTLTGDSEPFDNRAWLVPTQRRITPIAYIGRHEADDPQHAHFYVSRALGSARDSQIVLVRLDPAAAPDRLGNATLFIVAEPPSAPLLEALRLRAQAGAFVVTLLTSPEMITTASALAGETGWTAGKTDKGPAVIGQVDFAHPLFSLFADPRYSDFSHLRFWHAQPIDLPSGSAATVVARFDNGSAAVIESTADKGRLITWAGDWSPSASQWVLSTKFVPWLQALLERAAGGPPRALYAEMGDVGRLTQDPAARWRSAQEAADAFVPTRPSRPGLYQLKDYDGTRWVALELPAEESRTDPLPLDTFEQLGVPLKSDKVAAPTKSASARATIDAAAIEIESRQKLWRWILIAAAALLAIESLSGMALSRRQTSNDSLPAGG